MNKNRAHARAALAESARRVSIPIRKADVEKHVEIALGRNAEGETVEFVPLSALGRTLLAALTADADRDGIPYQKHEFRRH